MKSNGQQVNRRAPRRIGLAVAGGEHDHKDGVYPYGSLRAAAALAMILQRMPEVEACYLILDLPIVGAFPSDYLGLPTISALGGLSEIDTVIEVDAGALGQKNAAAFKQRGGTIISYVWRNIAADSFAHMSVKTPGDVPLKDKVYDAVWLPDHLWETCQAFARYTRSQKISRIPQIWSPEPLLAMCRADKISPFFRPNQHTGFRIGVFDLNDRPGSTFQLPLLAAEACYRTHPEAIKSVLMFGALRLKGWYHLSNVLLTTDLSRDKKVFAEDHHPVRRVLGAHVDMVVTHQWPDSPSDILLDLLYLGWPVAHNVKALSEAGYFYPRFDIAAGGAAISKARSEHGERIDAYRRAAQTALSRFAVDNPDNIEAFSTALSTAKKKDR